MNNVDDGHRNVEKEERGELLEAEPVDFDTAIAATGIGKFNMLLILLAVLTSWTSLFETTTMSYVFPAAQCDLNLSLEDKGMLNAATYAGTMLSAFFWGFLFDTFGRRKLLMIGFLLDAISSSLSGFSPNKEFLMFMKFTGGFIINGAYAAITTYLSELHVAKYRSRMPLLLGVGRSLGGIYLPLIAALILPLNFKLVIANILVLHSWGLYILLNCIPSILSFILFIFLPESPKFLMSKGRNKEALKVFQRIYSINFGKPPHMYPIKAIVEETTGDKYFEIRSFIERIKDGWIQIKPLFGFPYLKIFILICSLQIFAVMGTSTLRLWTPQLFQAVNDYKFLNNGTSSSLCEMLSTIRTSKLGTEECFVNFNNLEVYMNSAFAEVTSLVGFLIAGTIINAIGQKRLLNIIMLICSIVAGGIYFAPNGYTTTALLSIFRTLGSVGTNVVLVIIVNLFPTTMRTTTIALAIMFGRGAAMMGNLIFPHLLKIGCAPPFLSIAALTFACFLISLILPRQKKTFI